MVGPLMERQLEAVGEGLPNRAQAEEIMQRSLKVLYYRDKSTYNNWSIGFAEKVSVEVLALGSLDLRILVAESLLCEYLRL